MAAFVYSTQGTYTDSTHTTILVDNSQISLNINNPTSVFVLIDTVMDTVTATSANVFIFSDGSDATAYLNANHGTFYSSFGGDTVYMSGADDYATGGTGLSNTVSITGTSGRYVGVRSGDMITVSGSNNSVRAGIGDDTVTVNLPSLGGGNSIDGGAGNNTLTLSDFVSDPNVLTVDLGKSALTGASGLTIANFQNLNYTIANPNSSARRSASTTFTLESGTNTLDFSYSSGANTVYNTGGSTIAVGGSATDTMVGGTGFTKLISQGGNDTLYGGSGMSVLQPSGGGGTDRFYGGSGTEYLFGGAGIGNDYMYGAGGTDYFQGGGGNNVLVEGTYSDEFHGTAGNDFIYGSSAASKVYGGSGSDYVYTGASNQYFYSGTGKEYLYEEAGTMTNGRLDVLDHFQTQSAGGKGTFIFEPAADANATTFVASNGGTYIVNPAVNMPGGTSDVFVPNVAPSIVKAQTYFNL